MAKICNLLKTMQKVKYNTDFRQKMALNLTENLAIYLLANVRTTRAHNPKKNDAFYKTFYMYICSHTSSKVSSKEFQEFSLKYLLAILK